MAAHLMETVFAGRDALVLDGGMGTHLASYGCDLSDDLWSARLLRDDPAVVRRAHRDFFEAGADIAVSASYQASLAGFARAGLPPDEAERLVLRSVRLAAQARDEAGGGLVAAGIGPYGACLADGSEYTGDYGLGPEALLRWHRDRWHLLAASGADLMACETIPSHAEAEALAALIAETPGTPAWVSFSARDDAHIGDGTPIADAAALFTGLPGVVAVGVNCTAPGDVGGLLARAARSGVPGVAYPNTGRVWDAERRGWTGTDAPRGFGERAEEWVAAGARLVGGCCGTGPDHIRAIRDRIA